MHSILKKIPNPKNILNQKWFPKLVPARFLNVHEHISYELLKNAGINVPKYGIAKTKEEAIKIAEDLQSDDLVIKAQVLTGGRGVGQFKGGLKGGVKMASTPEEVGEYASKMIGDHLVTHQSGADGKICNKVMITERKYPKKEFYVAIMLERSFNGPVIIASSQGGVEIEHVAEKTPELIYYEPIDIMTGKFQLYLREIFPKF